MIRVINEESGWTNLSYVLTFECNGNKLQMEYGKDDKDPKKDWFGGIFLYNEECPFDEAVELAEYDVIEAHAKAKELALSELQNSDNEDGDYRQIKDGEEVEGDVSFYKENGIFYAFLSTNGSSGIKVNGNTPQEVASKLADYIADCFYIPKDED